jgi:acyl-CoA thioesterase YciA
MPGDANPYGDIFGGWLMAQMDLAGGLYASKIVRGRAVTVAVDGMSFLRPVTVGDEVSVYCSVQNIGRSSISVEVQAWRRDRHGDDAQLVTEAIFTFVSIGSDCRPVAIERTEHVQSLLTVRQAEPSEPA